MNERRLVLRPESGGVARKVTKIVGYGNGGFAVLTPYHRARSGWLLKMAVDYSKVGIQTPSREECVEYLASDRVKLSYHPDGFVQFSGENPGQILSGRDPNTGEPKGLGLITKPLSDPIGSGPSFCVTVWGLNEFEEAGDLRESDLTFEDEDFYYRAAPRTCNAYLIEGFVLPGRYWSGVRRRHGAHMLRLCFAGFEATGAVCDLRVLPLPNQDEFVALLASRVTVATQRVKRREPGCGWHSTGD